MTASSSAPASTPASTPAPTAAAAPLSDTFGLQLQQMRTDLLARIHAQRGGAVGRAEAAAARKEQASGDWAQDDTEQDLSIAMDERETAELEAIEQALQRVADGSYGLCLDCGVGIPTARLHANPTAMRCVACQEATER
jgi:DnaK suppressor protein